MLILKKLNRKKLKQKNVDTCLGPDYALCQLCRGTGPPDFVGPQKFEKIKLKKIKITKN